MRGIPSASSMADPTDQELPRCSKPKFPPRSATRPPRYLQLHTKAMVPVTGELTGSDGIPVASVSPLPAVQRSDAEVIGDLPTAEMLLRVVRDSHPAVHPLDLPARQLAELHTGTVQSHDVEYRRAAEVSRREAMRAIDRWIEAHVPQHRHGTAIHTETVGSVIDRLMATYVRAAHFLETTEVADDLALHAAWFRVAELVNGYDDLVAAIMHGERRLPTSA